MPLPTTIAYHLRLKCLRFKSPYCAALVELLGAMLRPQATALSNATVTDEMFAHLDAVSRQCPASIMRLAVWLDSLIIHNALSPDEANTILAIARVAGGDGGALATLPLVSVRCPDQMMPALCQARASRPARE